MVDILNYMRRFLKPTLLVSFSNHSHFWSILCSNSIYIGIFEKLSLQFDCHFTNQRPKQCRLMKEMYMIVHCETDCTWNVYSAIATMTRLIRLDGSYFGENWRDWRQIWFEIESQFVSLKWIRCMYRCVWDECLSFQVGQKKKRCMFDSKWKLDKMIVCSSMELNWMKKCMFRTESFLRWTKKVEPIINWKKIMYCSISDKRSWR